MDVPYREELLVRPEHIERALELVSVFTNIRTPVVCRSDYYLCLLDSVAHPLCAYVTNHIGLLDSAI